MDRHIKEAMDALDRITLEIDGNGEDTKIIPSYTLTVNALRWTATYRQYRDEEGWKADIGVFHRRGFILFEVEPNADYWTKDRIKRHAREAYKNYKTIKQEERA